MTDLNLNRYEQRKMLVKYICEIVAKSIYRIIFSFMSTGVCVATFFPVLECKDNIFQILAINCYFYRLYSNWYKRCLLWDQIR